MGRVQLVVATIIALVLGAVPLYYWGRPSPVASSDATSSAASISRPPVDPAKSLLAAALDGGVQTEAIGMGRVWVDSCKRGNTRATGDQCDRQPFFEEALVKAVLENPSCAPKSGKQVSISYALRVDYGDKTVQVFAGKTGSVRKKDAQPSIDCIQQMLPPPSWDVLPHQYTKYIIAVLATYPGDGTGR